MRRIAPAIAYFLTLLLALGLLSSLAVAQEKKKEDRLDGRIVMINKDTSVITIQRGNVRREIVYSSDTKYSYRNEAGKPEDLKEGLRVICLGKFDDKGRLLASRIDLRERR